MKNKNKLMVFHYFNHYFKLKMSSFEVMKSNGYVISHSTGSHLCPRSLDCARAGRHFCQPGSTHCGPCLRPLVENSHGRCVVKRHIPHPAASIKGRSSLCLLPFNLFTCVAIHLRLFSAVQK